MKIVLTGSLGNITRPLAIELLETGQELTIISSKADKQKDIEVLGAKAATGRIEDVDFLTDAFTGADIVYCMVPPPDVTQSFQTLLDQYSQYAQNYKTAIESAGVKRLVVLSTVGAHMSTGNGLLRYGYLIEQVYQSLPANIQIKFMRPVSFYYNLLSFIPAIKHQGIIATNYGGDTKKPWVSPLDIAAATAAAILTPFEGSTIQYVASEELSCNAIAEVLGKQIGQPGLQWLTITGEEALQDLIQNGVSPTTAQAFVEMNSAIQNGNIYADYYKNQPYMGKVTMAQYARSFAKIYQNQ